MTSEHVLPATLPATQVEAVIAVLRASWGGLVKATNAIWSAFWTLCKIALLVGFVALLISGSGTQKEKVLDMNYFLSLASPLETQHQVFTIGSHTMPKVEILAAVPEQERVQNPSMTAAQLQRAKWMNRTWGEVVARNEANQSMSSDNKKGFAATYVSDVLAEAMDKKGQKAMGGNAIAESTTLNVLVGAEVIPSLASGLLPVFSDADTAKWKIELAREKIELSELDMRRAKFFQTKFGPGTIPVKAPSDIEIRAAEDAAPAVSNGFNSYRPAGAPWSENERLEAACQALNFVANPALIPAVAVAPAAGAPVSRQRTRW